MKTQRCGKTWKRRRKRERDDEEKNKRWAYEDIKKDKTRAKDKKKARNEETGNNPNKEGT